MAPSTGLGYHHEGPSVESAPERKRDVALDPQREREMTLSTRMALLTLSIGAIGALMNRVRQPRPLVVLGLNVWMGTAAGADELVEIPSRPAGGAWASRTRRRRLPRKGCLTLNDTRLSDI